MRVYKLLNQKEFTTKLFTTEFFDNFLLTEFDISKDYSMFVDGRSGEGEYVTWGRIRPLAFAAIRGNELPKSFKAVIKLSKENTVSTLKSLGINLSEDTGLFLNIYYSDEILSCVCGTSTTEFMLTKDLENGWDDIIKKFFHQNGIEFEEMQ